MKAEDEHKVMAHLPVSISFNLLKAFEAEQQETLQHSQKTFTVWVLV